MSLKVIGAGFGRTGTRSLKEALEMLGFGPCHHMVEVFMHPEQVPLWDRAALGEMKNWEEIFAAYNSSCDWPSCSFYKELADFYPDAKVILTLRDPKSWFKSVSSTIMPAMKKAEEGQ
ncbi:MAG TPA: sulfotransferase, partial [Rhizomicrobium sp.]|nr:sulfotransferase [Rhizomicrobium sp.]